MTDEEEIEKLALKIVAEGLSVRAVEELVALGQEKRKPKKVAPPRTISPQLKEMSDRLADALDTRVNVELGKEKGKITIEFADLEDLQRIAQEIL
jgi:ParB family chromosome partitioning protein